MVALAGYEEFRQIHNGANSQVYRARRVKDSQPVILKFLNRDYPTSEQIRRYKQEYHITCQLDSPGIIKAYSLEQWQRSYAIVLEDFGAISLQQWLQERESLSLKEFLFLAIAIANSLAQIHAQYIIHKDINLTNIVFNPQTRELKIIDFGISTQLSRENPTLKNPNVLQGTLAYISPEQTGRMNRRLDYRTDFYSLGVTFYEMLTGKLPFESPDPLELVHCHIAKSPPAIVDLQPSIPQTIADIIVKLMAKNAEDRYQSADGLTADLKTCLNQLEETENIGLFTLGKLDISDRFQIPQKLYGREKEIATLLAAFERVAETGNLELMLVTGYSGIGKSSLIKELYKPITARRGYFISGKFDQFQRNIPYSAIVAAFRGLIEQLLGENEVQLQVWREKLLQALGNNGQLIIEVIPEVEVIIGKQPSVPILGANEAQHRFHLVFGNFIHVFCDSEHPLTLFLDDLQWADLATLKLMERMLVEGQTQYLLLLGAYRNHEVFASHPLAIALAKLQQNKSEAFVERGGSRIEQITLNPLPLEQIACLIGDTLGQTPEAVDDLARLIQQKTGGNPFFINEFLQALHDENLLQFHQQARSWQWDMAAIAAIGFTDNVVELMVGKLQQLPESSQEVLSLAACLGAEFDLMILTRIAEKFPHEIFELLKIALDRGFIFPVSELDENLLIQSYKFAHDRIQQAAYTLIPSDRKEATHYRIGKLLLKNIPLETREENLFELVNQLNYGMASIAEQKERDELAGLNLIACSKARDAAAYQVGRYYAKTGLSLLGERAWQRQYVMTLKFHNLAAELALLCQAFAEMERFAETVIKQTSSLLERVKVYQLKILSYTSQNQLEKAIAIAQSFLQQLKVTFPKVPTENDIRQAIAEIEQLIRDRDVEDLISLPMMAEAEKIAIVEIANSIIPAAYLSGSPLYQLLIFLSVKLSIQYGNTLVSPSVYADYAIVACNHLQDVDTGVKFCKLSLQIASQLDAKAAKPHILFIAGMFILHRKSHIKQMLPLLQKVYGLALEVGNLEYVGYAAHAFCLESFWCGQSLAMLEQEVGIYCHTLGQLKQLTTANYCRIYWQSILNLRGQGDPPNILSGELLQEEQFLSQLLSAPDLVGLYLFYLYKLMLCYLFEEIELAKTQAAALRDYVSIVIGTVGEPAFYFYDSLTSLATLFSGSQAITMVIQQVEENQTKLQQYWAKYAPMNHQHKVDLVAAEKCRVLGQKADAIEFYNQAIASAKANEYIQEEALANELAAKFYLDWGQEKVARVYMMDARDCYSRWGAIAKVKHLEDNYPQLCQSPTVRTSTNSSHSLSNSAATQQTNDPQLDTPQSTTSNSSINLDLTTFMKASQAIAREIVLSKLLAQLIKVLLENTGAQSCFLILETEGELLIEAETWADGKITVLQSMPLEFVQSDGSLPLLSSAVINYAARTRESVVLDDAQHEGNFTTQPYIQNFQVKSVLCVPLVNQGQLRGVAYLENNLTTGAFTRERVEIVQLLSGQAAIAISNAQLYSQLQESERQLKQFLEAVPVGIGIIDAKGHPYYTNRKAQEILGRAVVSETKPEEIADVYQNYIAQTDRLYPQERLPIIRALQGEACSTDDIEIHRGDRIIPLESWGTPVDNERGEIVYAIAAFQDITERKKAEKLLIDYNQSLERQLALSLENTRLYEASKCFVPAEFLSFLEKESIVDVKLGDQVERDMTVLFSDIRDFTTISEQMTPAENFAFINEYLGYMEPQIQKYDGFIDKYIGDAIMALFPNSADDAVKGAIAMLEQLKQYNQIRKQRNQNPIRIGIGLHTGTLILGTVGGLGRMDGTVIGDSVNLSSRVEGLTKTYGVSLLITERTWNRLNNYSEYDFRFIDKVKAKGKNKAVSLFEIFSADPPELREAKIATKEKFERAVLLYHGESFQEAARLFQECVDYHDGDRAARCYLERCHRQIA